MNFLTPFGWAGFVVLALILLLRELRPILERRNGKNGLALNGASLTAGQLPKEYWQLEMRESLVEGLKTTNELLARLVEVQEEMRSASQLHHRTQAAEGRSYT